MSGPLFTFQDTDGTANQITFTTGNTTNTGNHLGTSYSTYQTVYDDCGFENNTSHFNVINAWGAFGIQLWKVPVTGTYEIEVASAGGGTPTAYQTRPGGKGRVISGTKTLTQGDYLRIIVGSRGGQFRLTAGGGGASVIGLATSMTNAAPNGTYPWIMPGAGGGGGGSGGSGKDANASNSSESASASWALGTNTLAGSGGRNGVTSNGGWGGGGSGWSSRGGGNSNVGSGGGNTAYETHYNARVLNASYAPYGAYNTNTPAFSNPFYSTTYSQGAAGGFGGGGNGGYNGGGGGAGYTGGTGAGAGGGNYFNTSEMTGRVNVGTNNADTDGYVKITLTIEPPTVPTTNITFTILSTKYIDSGITSASGHANLRSALYDFETHAFTNCGKTGRNGPTLSQCISSYGSSGNWWNDTDNFNVIGASGVNGIQVWTVPGTGDYQITAKGAREGWSGYGQGAIVQSTFTLTEGDKYMILVGQMGTPGNGGGSWYAGGGGGGTFMVKGDNYTGKTLSDVLIIAGGGGGSTASGGGPGQSTYQDGSNATSNSTVGGTNSGAGNGGGGGGGLIGNGTSTSAYPLARGISFINGGGGGNAEPSGSSALPDADGGFGGGGGGGGNPGGGGGGIWGGSWGYSGTGSGSGYNLGGRGGGSHVSSGGSSTVFSTSNNNTHGSLTITATSAFVTSIALSYFRGATFTSGDPVPSDSDEEISINDDFKGRTFGTAGLYAFTSHTFTNCGKTGRYGPSLSQCQSAYSSQSWAAVQGYFDTWNGLQKWTVPKTGSYTIDAYGAEGGKGWNSVNSEATASTAWNLGGKSLSMIGTFSLTESDVIWIGVGQMGQAWGDGTGNIYIHRPGAGGGGTFVVGAPPWTATVSDILVIAGGGGGGGQSGRGTAGAHATTATHGTTAPSASGSNASTGSAGQRGDASTGTYALSQTGAGFLSDGYANPGWSGGNSYMGTSTPQCYATSGTGPYSTALLGGKPNTWFRGEGGFGGGGGTGLGPGGGGGGYSGGDTYGTWSSSGRGYGGGSINNGTNTANTTGRSGHGKVIITFVS